MRKSLSTFIDTCFDIKVFLKVGSYELHHYEDGSYADFRIAKIDDPKTILRLANNHELRIREHNGFVVIRVFENYEE